MKYDISVIIPVYNREKLIKNALNSVLKQTIADKIEIICVDDGSTDNTVEVIKNYQKKHENIFLYQQENSGPGVARNLGIDKANGEYIIFLDSDDWAPERAYELMLNYIREKDADVVIGRILRKIHGIRNNSWFFPERIEKYFNEYKNKNCSKEYIIPIVTPGPTNKIIRTSFLKEHNIYIPNEKMGEDLIFCLKLFRYAEKIFLLDEVVYMYESNFSNGESLCSQVSSNIIASGFRVVQDAFSFFEGQNKVFYETENILGLFQYVLDRFWKLEETEEKELIFEQIKNVLSSFKGRKELYIPIQYLMKIDLDTLLLLPYKAYKLQVELLEKMNPVRLQQVEKYVDRWKSNGNAERELAQVRNSLSFRIGSAIMWLPCKIRDLIKGKK